MIIIGSTSLFVFNLIPKYNDIDIGLEFENREFSYKDIFLKGNMYYPSKKLLDKFDGFDVKINRTLYDKNLYLTIENINISNPYLSFLYKIIYQLKYSKFKIYDVNFIFKKNDRIIKFMNELIHIEKNENLIDYIINNNIDLDIMLYKGIKLCKDKYSIKNIMHELDLEKFNILKKDFNEKIKLINKKNYE